MTEIVLTIPGDPTAKGRPRVFGDHGVTPRKTVSAENRIYAAFIQKYPDIKPMEGPIEVSLSFYMSRRGKPDWDNLAKLATDALNGIAYKDDAQIFKAQVFKYTPDKITQGAKKGTWRNRKSGDPLTYHGIEYEAHTHIEITEHTEFNPKGDNRE